MARGKEVPGSIPGTDKCVEAHGSNGKQEGRRGWNYPVEPEIITVVVQCSAMLELARC